MLHHLYNFIAGVVFGLANVIPGVSGGTMAVVFGVYERLINLIANIRKDFKKELPFVAVFGAGAVVGILAFGKLMKWVLVNHAAEANAFFIGVILGSIPIIAGFAFKKKSKRTGKSKWVFNAGNIIPLIVTFALMIPMALSTASTNEAKEAAKAAAKAAAGGAGGGFSLLDTLLYIVYGVIAVTTMIIPGISGSFVMLLIGFYETIITAVADLNFLVLVPFGLGCVIGLFTVAKLIKWLLKKFKRPSYAAILGFVLGSILCIFPGWSQMLAFWPILMVVVGFAAITLCNRISE
ncbi:MAG: DUF368 domain-containing protein [Clostridia bacterium]|nr:DUF368 domain-containing protein [Clostridia bacterium]